jgi:two-component system chemotaxis response regulator CheB
MGNKVRDFGKRNIVVIGSSAGGIEALIKLFSGLPRDSSASFLVTQHLSPHSASELDRILQKCTQMHVAFAQDRQLLMPDTVYLAPRDRHLMIEGNCVRITRGPKECRARPAVDVLFRSAALAFGPRVIGVVLTGALDDGTAGLWQIKDRNGLAFVQDPDEAQYSSMPTSAIEHVKVDCVGSIDRLVSEIAKALATEVPLPEAPASSQRLAIETLIAFEGNGMQAGVMSLGQVSKYTCPECHGVLVQIEEGGGVRFRCHTGHAYSPQSLLVEVNEAIDKGLWDTIRAIEERILLLQQRADTAEAAGKVDVALQLRTEAERVIEKYQPLRALVLDSSFFSSD